MLALKMLLQKRIIQKKKEAEFRVNTVDSTNLLDAEHDLVFGDFSMSHQEKDKPEFKPLVLINNRRNSLGSIDVVPLSSDQGVVDLSEASLAIKAIRSISEASTEDEDYVQEDDDFTSEDEIFIKQFPNSALACERRATRSSAYLKGKEGNRSSGKKKNGKGKNKSSR